MTKKMKLVVYFKDGRVQEYSQEEFVGFKPMAEGLLFIQLSDKHTRNDTNDVLEVVTGRQWLNLSEIHHFDVQTTTSFDGELEVLKYDKFKSRGIDLVHTDISQTVIDPNKVAADVEKDKHVQVVKQKLQRKSSKKLN